MINSKFDSKYNGLIVAVATNIGKSHTGHTSTDASLNRYNPKDLRHNLDYLASRADQSTGTLLGKVLDGNQTYTQETHDLFRP